MLCFYVWTELKGNKGLMTQETWSLPTFAVYELAIMRWNNNTNRDEISVSYTAVNGTNTPAEAQSTNTDPTLWISISTGKCIFFKETLMDRLSVNQQRAKFHYDSHSY